MKRKTMSKDLRVQRISSRRSTFSNAFASALADFERFDDLAIIIALTDLVQDSESDVECVYCGAPAATWDHVFPRVINGEFSGHGHSARNLVPCCRRCNEKKGKKEWRDWLRIVSPPNMVERAARIERFLGDKKASAVALDQIRAAAPDELAQFQWIRQQIFELLDEADQVADAIRKRVVEATAQRSTP